MTDMYLISGFLGAGKTTLIQKLLTEAFKSKKVALIENDFGDFSVDAALLREGVFASSTQFCFATKTNSQTALHICAGSIK